MSNKLKKSKDEQGFTIIEVLIVLAIAGLILLIVLIAVPQLQKNQRNEARRNVLSRISTEVNSYAGNNGGAIPTQNNDAGTGFTGGFTTRYLQDGGVYRDTFKSPTGNDFSFALTPAAGITTLAEDTVYYSAGAACATGETPGVPGSGNPRDFSIAVGLEGGAGYCVDNGSN